MIFYHYTALQNLEPILREGLNKGEIPITHRVQDCLNGVWFTTSASASGHGLSDAKDLSDEECRKLGVPKGTSYIDKRAARITVKMPKDKLKHWPAYGKKRLDPKWYRTLSQIGGGEKVARTWYISLKTIMPDQFAKIEVRGENGEWIEYDETQANPPDS